MFKLLSNIFLIVIITLLVLFVLFLFITGNYSATLVYGLPFILCFAIGIRQWIKLSNKQK